MRDIPIDVVLEILEHVAREHKAQAVNAFKAPTAFARDALAAQSRPDEDVVALCAVSRRFHHATRHVRALWTTVTDRMPVARTQLFLARSGDRPLTVVVHSLRGHTRTAHGDRFLHAVAREHRRWGEFYARVSGNVCARSMRLPLLPCFPVLTAICVSWTSTPAGAYSVLDSIADTHADKDDLFLEPWTTPALRKMHLSHGLGFTDALATVPKLSLAFSLQRRFAHRFWAPLAVCTALTVLELTLTGSAWQERFAPLRLESLRDFIVYVRAPGTAALANVLRALDFPNMRQIDVFIHARDVGRSHKHLDFLLAVFPPEKRVSRLVYIAFAIDWGEDAANHQYDDEGSTLEFFMDCRRFRWLRCLSLGLHTVVHGRYPTTRPEDIPSSLHTLQLTRVTTMQEWVFRFICATFARRNVVMKLRPSTLCQSFDPHNDTLTRCRAHYATLVEHPESRFQIEWVRD